MTNRDRGVVAALGAVLVALVLVVLLPGAGSAPGVSDAGPSAEPSAGSSAVPPAVYREGMVGRPSSINPLTARTQADRDLAALIFSGLVALGPDGTYRPDLASGWTVNAKGDSWTFTIRPDARWQDGEPVTAADVVFTVDVLKDPAYTGPLASSWREVTATAVDDTTVRFDLATPLGGFLEAATVGLLPEHLLRDTPIETLADAPFSLQPIGSGPFVLTSWNAESASLVPADLADTPIVDASPGASPGSEASPGSASVDPGASPSAGSAGAAGSAGVSPLPSADSSAPSPTPSAAAGRALPGIAMSFYPDATALEAAYRAGELDAAVGLAPSTAQDLAAVPGNRLLTYPRTTLSAIALDLRPGSGELRMPKVRRALLSAIDRAKVIGDVYGGAAVRADSPIPPSSWAFDPKAARPVRFDPKRTATDLKASGWKKLATGWAAPGMRKPYVMELIAPDAESNPTGMGLAEAVGQAWRDVGFKVTVTGLPPATFVDRLQKGDFTAAAIDVAVGLDPDLYPLFASTQVVSGGSNVSGIQDVDLDHDLIAARAPGTLAARKAAFSKLQKRLADKNYLLPIAFRNDLVVVSDRLQGPQVRELGDSSDRFWDVLTWRLAEGR